VSISGAGNSGVAYVVLLLERVVQPAKVEAEKL